MSAIVEVALSSVVRVVAPRCRCNKGHKRFGRCRVSRPLCHRMREKAWGRPCQCDGYHYPHRMGGGFCEHGNLSNVYRNRVLYGPDPAMQRGEAAQVSA